MAHGKKLPCTINLMVSPQSVTAELGYLGFQDSLKKICSSVVSKLREAMPPVTSHVATL